MFNRSLHPDAVRRALAGLPSLGLGRITAIVSVGEPLWCGVADEIETLQSVADGLPIEFETLVIASTPAELEAAAERLARRSPQYQLPRMEGLRRRQPGWSHRGPVRAL